VPLAASDVEMELTTPTGAAILTTVCESFGPLPAMTIETIGLGAGTKDFPKQANILRLFLGTIVLPASDAGASAPRGAEPAHGHDHGHGHH
jgi:pyridinium-3,5-bisthiocarboxylic acid mononucleotide nickel chelatase